MADMEKGYQLIIAILQKDDFEETSSELAQHGFFMTRLSSSGGFLRKENVTIMIGVEDGRHDEVMDILKKTAGRRQKVTFGMAASAMDIRHRGGAAAAPVHLHGGGVTVFTLKMDDMQKF